MARHLPRIGCWKLATNAGIFETSIALVHFARTLSVRCLRWHTSYGSSPETRARLAIAFPFAGDQRKRSKPTTGSGCIPIYHRSDWHVASSWIMEAQVNCPRLLHFHDTNLLDLFLRCRHEAICACDSGNTALVLLPRPTTDVTGCWLALSASLRGLRNTCFRTVWWYPLSR